MTQTTLVTPSDALVEIVKDMATDDWCLPVSAAPITKYAMTISHCHETMNGVYWLGYIWRDGKKIIKVENTGCGASNRYYQPRPDTSSKKFNDDVKQFRVDANACFQDEEYENHDRLCSFLDLIANGL